jgi:hypothetical protein
VDDGVLLFVELGVADADCVLEGVLETVDDGV